jgi:putative glutamine amidotransferase
MASKQIVIEPDSRLASVMGRHALHVNSLHRQGIDRLGRGLRIAARDEHGIVQAIELTDDAAERFVVGVQWHPEYLPLRPSHQRLFRALAEAARARSTSG